MAAKDRGARESRERTRLYQARQAYQDGLIRRRTRDNVIAGVVGGLLILGLVGAQTVYFTVGPGAPAPEPTPTPTMTSDPVPSDSPLPDPSPSATQ